MSKTHDTGLSFGTRARSHAREIALALALTVGAAVFMVTTLSPTSEPAAKTSSASRQ